MSLGPPLFTLNRIGQVRGWDVSISTSSDPHSQSPSALPLNDGVGEASRRGRVYILQIARVRDAPFDDNLLALISNTP